jgi:hypothetical protein
MRATTRRTAERLRKLPDIEKQEIVDELLAQLDKPDPEIDRLWAEEAKRRLRAFRQGRMAARVYL